MSLTIEGDVRKFNCLKMCCDNPQGGRPKFDIGEGVEETLNNFIIGRSKVIADCIKGEGDSILGCKNCGKFYKNDWKLAPLISYVNLSMYPSPCQCKCCYCSSDRHFYDTEEVRGGYEKIFDFLEYAKKGGFILPNASWQVSPGEITIHPFKERIYDLLSESHASFLSNCFVFDDRIAQQLKKDGGSSINFSIDAGTNETWERVKGTDNFTEVCDNVSHYHANTIRKGQIILKYIVLPGVNDSLSDFKSVTELMKRWDVATLQISRDVHVRYSQNNDEKQDLLRSVARLKAICEQNGLNTTLFVYDQAEQKTITELSDGFRANVT